jgi:hypothetical protein
MVIKGFGFIFFLFFFKKVMLFLFNLWKRCSRCKVIIGFWIPALVRWKNSLEMQVCRYDCTISMFQYGVKYWKMRLFYAAIYCFS